MLLSLRGWGPEEFRLARPEFHDAARWAIFAERVAPHVMALKATMNAPLSADPRLKVAGARARLAASSELPYWRRTLGLEDD